MTAEFLSEEVSELGEKRNARYPVNEDRFSARYSVAMGNA